MVPVPHWPPLHREIGIGFAEVHQYSLARRCSRQELPTRLSYEEPPSRVVTVVTLFWRICVKPATLEYVKTGGPQRL
jgi:hypothetical protein